MHILTFKSVFLFYIILFFSNGLQNDHNVSAPSLQDFLCLYSAVQSLSGPISILQSGGEHKRGTGCC